MSGIPANQIFCLRWNNHQSTIVSILEQQLRSETLVDVTLAVDDGHILRAHKMVLCACSPYFAELLSRSPDKHPIVILRDVTFRDMQAILDFMYRGEVSVPQASLDRLFKVAESLKVRGLADVSSKDSTHHRSHLTLEEIIGSQSQQSQDGITTELQQRNGRVNGEVEGERDEEDGTGGRKRTLEERSPTSSSKRRKSRPPPRIPRSRDNLSSSPCPTPTPTPTLTPTLPQDPLGRCTDDQDQDQDPGSLTSVSADAEEQCPPDEERTIIKVEVEESSPQPPTPSSGEWCMEPEIWMEEGYDYMDYGGNSSNGSGSNLLDYKTNPDGSVTCKLCTEYLPSRMHWYRHKYRVHELRVYRCGTCPAYFKSKRGLDNHSAVKHGIPPVYRSVPAPDRQIPDEEKFVLDIIEKVKQECEGTGIDLERRGYSKHLSHLDVVSHESHDRSSPDAGSH